MEGKHLNWSSEQSRILTADGEAEAYYTADRGFPFSSDELPHYRSKQDQKPNRPTFIIAGAWKRTRFFSGSLSTTEKDERVYNLQTPMGFFIDLRIPCTREFVLCNAATRVNTSSLNDLSDQQLRYYARQHVFGGYGQVEHDNGRWCCTRKHWIDWNFVGIPRSRPNKWYIEPASPRTWTEWAWATDNKGEPYYGEDWESLLLLPQATKAVLVLSKAKRGMVVMVGDHFNYLRDRTVCNQQEHMSLVGLVDDLVSRGHVEEAKRWLNIEAGHGRVTTNGWVLDTCIEFWKEGRRMWDNVEVVLGDQVENCHILWCEERWDILETNLRSPLELQELVTSGAAGKDLLDYSNMKLSSL